MEKIRLELYQSGFYFLLGILCTIIFINSCTKPREIIKETIVHDTIKVETVKDKPLTENNVKAELKKQGIKHSNVVLAQAKLETGHMWHTPPSQLFLRESVVAA